MTNLWTREASARTATAPASRTPARSSGAEAVAANSGRPSRLRLALAGGGTGGHLLPGRHLVAHLGTRDDVELESLVWFTSGREVEDRALLGLEDELDGVRFERVVLAVEPAGGGAPSRARLASRTPSAVFTARAALRRSGADVLLGLGGFTSLPAVLAARSLGIPVVLLEVNAVSGAATRWLAPLAACVLHTFDGAAGKGRVRIGPLLPPELGDAATRPRDYAEHEERATFERAALGFEATEPLLVVLGGSQGAGSLNTFVREHDAALAAHGVQVLHQTGPGRLAEAAAARAGYRAVEFTQDVPRLLAAATLVLCRAGASTLLELAAAGAPAVVVPYPHAADGHQEKNARELGDGVRVVADADLGAAFVPELVALLGPSRTSERAEMNTKLRAAVPLDGAERALAVLLDLARPRGR